MFEVRPYWTIFLSYDVPFKAIITSDRDDYIDVIINGTTYKTITVTKGTQEVTVWDEVPGNISEGFNDVVFSSQSEPCERRFKVLYAPETSQHKIVETYNEHGNPLPTMRALIDVVNRVFESDVGHYDTHGLPNAYVDPDNTIVEFCRIEPDGIYYWIGRLKDVPDKLYLKKGSKAAAIIAWDRTNIITVLKHLIMQTDMPEGVTEEELDYMLQNLDAWTLASMITKYMNIPHRLIEAYYEDDTIVTVYEVKSGGIVAWIIVALLIILVIRLAAIPLIREVRHTLYPREAVAERIAESEAKKAEIIKEAMSRYGENKALKLANLMYSANVRTHTTIIQKTEAGVPGWLFFIILVVAITFILLGGTKR